MASKQSLYLPPELRLDLAQSALIRTEHALATTEKQLDDARRQLLEKHRKFLATFEQAAVGIAHVSLDGRWLEVNLALCDIVGYSHEELQTLSFQEITYPDDLNEDLELAGKLLRGEITHYHLEKRYLRKNGEIIWIKVSATLVRDLHHQPDYFVAVIENIHDRKLAQQALSVSQRRLDLAMDAANLGMFDFYGQGDPRNYWSYWVRRHFGILDDTPLSYERLVNAVHAEDWPHVYEVMSASMSNPGSPYHVEYRTVGEADRVLRWIEANGRSFLDTDKRTVRLTGTTLDITPRKEAELASRTVENRIRAAFDNLLDVVVIYDRDLVIRYINPAVETTSGMPRTSFLGKHESELFPSSVTERWHPALKETFQTGIGHRIDIELELPAGLRYLMISFVPLRDAAGKVNEVMGVVHDYTEHRLAEEKSVRLAMHDALTGLPNRALLFSSGDALEATLRQQRQGAMLYIDLDRFKLVNDLHGHQTGDDLLKATAARLSREMRAVDQVFRLGGDEFLVLLTDITDRQQVAQVAQRISRSLATPFPCGQIELQISASIGISIAPHDGSDLDTLFNAADSAMYAVKEAGRNHWQFYSAELARQQQQQLLVQENIRTALPRNELVLRFQPIVCARTHALASVEALLRWPMSGVGPDQFISAAEATGAILSIGDWVVDQSCQAHRQWLAQGLPPIPVAVNVSPLQLRDRGFRERLLRILNNHQLTPAALQLELTESTALTDLDNSISILSQLREDGFRTSLDDFGTGFSSLSYLSRLPVDKIKIDKSFVQSISDNPGVFAVTEAIVILARRLNMEVVAEGVESLELLRTFSDLGCSQVQGYFFSHPLEADALARWAIIQGVLQ